MSRPKVNRGTFTRARRHLAKAVNREVHAASQRHLNKTENGADKLDHIAAV